MSTFKTALRMALAHPFYLLIYTVFISLMGVFIAASVSWNSSQLTEYKPYDTNVIVVDRDDSDLSRALTKHLGSRFELVTGIGDDTYDLADALSKSNSAKGSADCVFFIPEGFEDDLVAAARAGESLPKLDVTYGAGTMAAALSSAEASRWISLAGAAAALEPAVSNGSVAKAAELVYCDVFDRDAQHVGKDKTSSPRYALPSSRLCMADPRTCPEASQLCHKSSLNLFPTMIAAKRTPTWPQSQNLHIEKTRRMIRAVIRNRNIILFLSCNNNHCYVAEAYDYRPSKRFPESLPSC